MPTLYLIPITIADDTKQYIPPITLATLHRLDCFFVERIRTARRFIKSLDAQYDIDGSQFIEMDKRDMSVNHALIDPIISNQRDFAIMSESGLPCIADPGHQVVDKCRRAGYTIKPLSGPGSIFMSLMASGLNGQQFVFHGYLPIKDKALTVKLKSIDDDILKKSYTHIFIETPYRNNRMYKSLLENMSDNIKLSMAIDLTGQDEKIDTMLIGNWKKKKDKLMPKKPCIFLLGR